MDGNVQLKAETRQQWKKCKQLATLQSTFIIINKTQPVTDLQFNMLNS